MLTGEQSRERCRRERYGSLSSTIFGLVVADIAEHIQQGSLDCRVGTVLHAGRMSVNYWQIDRRSSDRMRAGRISSGRCVPAGSSSAG